MSRPSPSRLRSESSLCFRMPRSGKSSPSRAPLGSFRPQRPSSSGENAPIGFSVPGWSGGSSHRR
eukprot:4763158-Pyramimonas_sp.AAC.1